MARFLLLLAAALCATAAGCSGSRESDAGLEFPVALRRTSAICPEEHHRKGRRRSRSHGDLSNTTSHLSRNPSRNQTTKSPLFENQLLQTLEQKALASKDKKNKSTAHQHRKQHHHQHAKQHHDKDVAKIDDASKKYPRRKYLDVDQGKTQYKHAEDRLVRHQHVDVSLIPSEAEVDQAILNRSPIGDRQETTSAPPVEATGGGKGSNVNSVLGRLEEDVSGGGRPMKDRMFVSENCSVVLAQTGSTAEMHCEVSDMGDNTVTWIRRRDYHLLTVGLTTYSSDERFFAAYAKNVQDVALHVRFARDGDEGLYECQISSHPPTSLFVELRVVEAVAVIVGGPDKIVKAGSPIRLTCHLRHSTEPPQYVFWYHEERMINYDLGGGVTVRHGKQSSELVIEHADKLHAGNYSCVPSNARPASVNVHILQNEKPAAMQHGVSKSECGPAYSPIHVVITLMSTSIILLSS